MSSDFSEQGWKLPHIYSNPKHNSNISNKSTRTKKN